MTEGATSDGRTLLLYGRSGPWCLEASYARAFRDLGWRVVAADVQPDGEDLARWIRSRLARRLARRSLRLRRLASRCRNQRVRDQVLECRPDLVLVINGGFLMPETVASVREAGIPVAVYHPDAPVPGNPNHRPEHGPVAREADASFVWSRRLAEQLERGGARRVAYLPFAWDPEVFPNVGPGANRGPDVVFVGGWDRHRERWLEAVAERFDLRIWGPDYWSTRTRSGSPLRDCWQGGALRGREAAEMVATAAIVLNVLRQQNLPDGTNMRTFEVPGAGGFLLSHRSQGAMEIYPEGEAGAYFDTVGEMLEQIDRSLRHEERRRAIARTAHEITARAHRYVHRAREILSTLGLT